MNNLSKTYTAQFTLCGSQGKRLIAECIMRSNLLKKYNDSGRIILKGSSTVSCLTNLLCGKKMRLCGRISKQGMKGAASDNGGAHVLLWEKGAVRNIDEELDSILPTLSSKDLFITGANAIDAFGHAALLYGSEGGGAYGKCIPFLKKSGIRVLVLTSISKLIPGNLNDLLAVVDRNSCSFSYGMSCGLLPIEGDVLTEVEAIQLYAEVKAIVFAAGGHTEAENSVGIQIRGRQEETEKILKLLAEIKECPEENLMSSESEIECRYPCSSCARHLGCIYAHKAVLFQ